jgi:hypothetical protein
VDPAQARFPRSSKIAVELNALLVHLTRNGTPPMCPNCSHPLDLHQPDENAPGELLATCETCEQWYLLHQLGDQGADLVLLELPSRATVEEFAKKCHSPPA